MSEIKIDLTLTFKIPDEGLNVNGLLFGLKNVESEIMLTITKILFNAIEDRVIASFKDTDNGRYVRNGRQRARTIKTSFGYLEYRFAQLVDRHTDKTLIPLREVLKIPKYRRYQNESMESSVGLAVHLSYNRANKEVRRIRGTGASRWTVRRRLFEFSQCCEFGDLKKIPYRFLMPDSTKVHLQEGPKGKDLGQRSLRWALASTGVSKPFDILGVWVGWSWEDIAKDLKQRLNYEGIEVLISDGEPGILDNFLKESMRHQRCIIHGRRDFPYILYRDGLKKKDQKEFMDLLESVPALNWSKKRIEKLSDEDRSYIAHLCQRTEACFKE